MNRDTEALLKSLQKITLTDAERALLHSRIKSILSTPVTSSSSARPIPTRGVTPSPFQGLLLRHNRMVPIGIALALMLSVGGGTAIAAEQSVPGDLLYPIKVNVEEKVAAAFALSAEAKADLDVRLAEKRLKEAVKLEAKADATTEVSAEHRAEVKARLIKHLSKTKERVGELRRTERPEAAAKVEARLKAALDAHPAILNDLDVSVSFDKSDPTEVNAGVESSTEVNDSPYMPLYPREEKLDIEGPESRPQTDVEVDANGKVRLGPPSTIIETNNSGHIRISF